MNNDIDPILLAHLIINPHLKLPRLRIKSLLRRANEPLERETNACTLLRDGLTKNGATVTQRQKGYSNYNEIARLIGFGLLEARAAGPRGGKRYFTTPLGEAYLNHAAPPREHT